MRWIVLSGRSLAAVAAVVVILETASFGYAAETKTPAKIDPNTATAAQLQELPGVTEAIAKKIVAGRPYKTLDDLSKDGIPATTLSKIKPQLAIAEAAAPAVNGAAKMDGKMAKAALLNVNTATAAELQKLPGIDAVIAKKIIAGRPYKNINELTKHGVSAGTFAKIKTLVATTSPKSPTTANAAAKSANDSEPKLVNLNTASLAELQELAGIGEANAKKIVAGRPYKSVEDLDKTKIPATTLSKIKPLVTVGGMQPSQSVAKPVTTEAASKLVDLNTASEAALEGVSGIGTAYAKKIIAGRPYTAIDDLSKAGVPAATIAKIRPLVTTGRKFVAPPQKGMVWVNLDSKAYHKEGSRWYGRTKNGKYMTEADALKEGDHAAKN